MILGAGGAEADLIRETLKESEAAGLEESKQPHHELPVGGLPPPTSLELREAPSYKQQEMGAFRSIVTRK